MKAQRSLHNRRPESPKPQEGDFLAFLAASGRHHFSGDEISLLKKLHNARDKFLDLAFELYLTYKDEPDFLDTLRNIIKSHRKNAQQSHQDLLETKSKSQASERSEASRRSDFRDNDFEILSVCTITHGENMSEANTVGEGTFRAFSANTPAFNRDPRQESFQQSQGEERFEFTPETQKQQPSQYHSALHDDKRLPLQAGDSITEARPNDESSPQNADSEHHPHMVSSFAPSFQQPTAKANLVASLVVPQAKDNRPWAFSFYQKKPAPPKPEDQTAGNGLLSEPPKDEKTNQIEFSGFGINDTEDRNSAAPSGNFFGGNNSKRKQDESRRNSASDNNGFNMYNRNLSDNFAGDLAPLPSFGVGYIQPSETDSVHIEQSEVTKPAPPQVIPFEVKSVAHLANMSFNPAGFKALKSMFPPTIVEQKDESEALGSPEKKDHSVAMVSQTEILESPTKDGTVSPPRFQIEPILTAEGSPLKQKQPNKTSKQNKGYLAQILRYVLQHDGADSNLAKLCADLVASSESGSQGASSFPADLLQFAKKKFTKRMSDYLPPIMLEAILDRGSVFLPELVACNITDDVHALGQKLVHLSEDNPDIVLEGDKIKKSISNAMIDQAKKNPAALAKEKPMVKLKKIGTSMNIEDPESSKSMSEFSAKRSTMTKASRISGREDRRRAENELTEKIYASMAANPKCRRALSDLIEIARKQGERIDGFQRRTLEEMLEMVRTFHSGLDFNTGSSLQLLSF